MFSFSNTALLIMLSGKTRNSRIGSATLSNTVKAENNAPC
jgi:hypothetical protein